MAFHLISQSPSLHACVTMMIMMILMIITNRSVRLDN